MLDVRAGGLGHPQPVQGQQGDQRVLRRRAEPGGDQQRAEFVAVQRDGVRLIVDPRAADMGGRGVVQELFLHRVTVEPGDGAQPPGDRGAGPAPGFQVAGEAFDVGAADREQSQGAGPAPGGELAQVQGVGLTGQAAVPGQEPGERETFGIARYWLEGDKGGCGGSHRGTSRSWLRPTRPSQPASAIVRSPPSSALLLTRCHDLRSAEPYATPGNAPNRRIFATFQSGRLSVMQAQIR